MCNKIQRHCDGHSTKKKENNVGLLYRIISRNANGTGIKFAASCRHHSTQRCYIELLNCQKYLWIYYEFLWIREECSKFKIFLPQVEYVQRKRNMQKERIRNDVNKTRRETKRKNKSTKCTVQFVYCCGDALDVTTAFMRIIAWTWRTLATFSLL